MKYSILLLLIVFYIVEFFIEKITLFRKKSKNFWKRIGINVSRSLLYTIFAYLLSFNYGDIFFPIFSFCFFLIWSFFLAGWKPKDLWGFFIKNLLKIVFLFIISYIWHYLSSVFINPYTFPSLLFDFYSYSLGFFIAIETGAEFVEILLNQCHLSKYKKKSKKGKTNYIDHGKIIGRFERFLIYSFTITNNIGAISIILAAKSVFRLIKQDEKHGAEYIIIGTLSSFSFAFSIGMAFTKILDLLKT